MNENALERCVYAPSFQGVSYIPDLSSGIADTFCQPLQGLLTVIRLFHIEIASGEYIGKYDPRVMYDSKRNVADLLNEHEEKKSVWEFLRHQKSQAQEIPQKRRGEWER